MRNVIVIAIAAFMSGEAQTLDKFGVGMLHPTLEGGREWFNRWNEGTQRDLDWGPDKVDPEFIVKGNTKCTIYGASGPNAGQIRITGANPRLYVRGTASEAVPPPAGTPKWNNVEVTFYGRTVNAGSKVAWAGLEAVCRTNHFPDSDDPSTPGYGGRILFDGRADIEKELSHGKGSNIQSAPEFIWNEGDGSAKSSNAGFVAANGGKPVYESPLGKWIGFKLVARNVENNTKVLLELYVDKSEGVNGGDWRLVKSITDVVFSEAASAEYFSKVLWFNGADFKSKGSATHAQHGKPLTEPNYSIYLRTDGNAEQYYRFLSVREIAPVREQPVSLAGKSVPGKRPGETVIPGATIRFGESALVVEAPGWGRSRSGTFLFNGARGGD